MRGARLTKKKSEILPLHPLKAVLFFGLPALVTNLLFWKAIPVLDFFAPRLFFTFLIEFGLLGLLSLLLSLSFYRSEGNGWSRESFAKRFRLRKLNKRAWLSTLFLVIVFYGAAVMLGDTAGWIQDNIRSSPKYWARMIEPDPNYFMEMSFQNRASLIIAFLSLQFFYSAASELWWRGYLLPRQELQHGGKTWFIHGLLWTAYESFMFWQTAMVLPGALAISYAAQKEQTIWPGILARTLTGFPSFMYAMGALFSS